MWSNHTRDKLFRAGPFPGILKGSSETSYFSVLFQGIGWDRPRDHPVFPKKIGKAGARDLTAIVASEDEFPV
jgi:hypothetical protein